MFKSPGPLLFWWKKKKKTAKETLNLFPSHCSPLNSKTGSFSGKKRRELSCNDVSDEKQADRRENTLAGSQSTIAKQERDFRTGAKQPSGMGEVCWEKGCGLRSMAGVSTAVGEETYAVFTVHTTWHKSKNHSKAHQGCCWCCWWQGRSPWPLKI